VASEFGNREALEATYLERVPLLRQTAEALSEAVAQHLGGLDRIDQIRFRVKDASSFLDKVFERRVEPPYAVPLLEVEDQIAGRINVFFLDDVEVVKTRVASLFGAVEISERRPERVTEFDYEGFHGIYNIPPQCKPAGWESREDLPATFELQVRTLFQHAWAEPQHDIAYKPEVDLLFDERREVAWVAASAWGADHAFNRLAAAIAARGRGTGDVSNN
jgi:ppGpp synthetase/RelA/SpoT-type nucleotidyltranferase